MPKRSGPKSADPTDKYVGTRIRLRRMIVGMTQEGLGDKLGVTFQQIQKYEKGINRVGSGRLRAIAEALGVEVGYFFEGAPGTTAPTKGERETTDLTGLLVTRDGLALNRAFLKIGDAKTRRSIVDLVEQIAA